MSNKIVSVPILNDNYVHIIINENTRECALVDPGVATTVQKYLLKENLRPKVIFITHHHWDHIGGVQELQKAFQVQTFAPAKEQKNIPFADQYLEGGESFNLLGTSWQILHLPGHTHGHIAYYAPKLQSLFCGDVLFSLGCGRVFDGTLEEHYESLQKIKTLPPETLIYCTHEYTELNLKFCLSRTPDDSKLRVFEKKVQGLRTQGLPTVPFYLAQEMELNPFLKARDLAEFSELREARNHF